MPATSKGTQHGNEFGGAAYYNGSAVLVDPRRARVWVLDVVTSLAATLPDTRHIPFHNGGVLFVRVENGTADFSSAQGGGTIFSVSAGNKVEIHLIDSGDGSGVWKAIPR